jgi:hypothetical protein
MKPTPANPRIIIAHVEGSGTGVRISVVKLSSVVPNTPALGLMRMDLISSAVLSKPKKNGLVPPGKTGAG